MKEFNFADSYKLAGLAPTPEIIRMRQEAFAKLRKEIDSQRIIDLVRIYFGLPVTEIEWFRKAFFDVDPSFTLIENARETQVLAACLINAVVVDGQVLAGLMLLTTAAAGNRVPTILPEILSNAQTLVREQSIAARAETIIDLSKAKLLSKSKLVEDAKTLPENDWPKLKDTLKKVGDEIEASKSTINSILNGTHDLNQAMITLREETSMLWWYIGGWSDLFGCPYSDLSIAVASIIAGGDLARLTNGLNAPIAAPAIFYRVISIGRTKADFDKKISITELIEAFTIETLSNFEFGEFLQNVKDICPITSALFIRQQNSGIGIWTDSYVKNVIINKDAAFSPTELAMQFYRETLILAELCNENE